MALAELKADTKINSQRLRSLDVSKMDRNELAKFVKVELAENVWPWLEGLVEAVQEEHGKLEEEIESLDEAVEGLEEDASDDALHPETAQQILGVLTLGRQIAIEITPALQGKALDEMKRKRLAKMVKQFRQAVEIVAEIVVAVTVQPDEEDDDKPDGAPANDEADAGEGGVDDEDGDDDADGDEDDGLDAPGEEG